MQPSSRVASWSKSPFESCCVPSVAMSSRRCFLLPHSQKMRISMMAERDELDQLFAEEIRSFHGDQVGDVGTESVEQLEMMKERFVVDLLELDLRADGACSAWKAHMDNAAERLMRRDKKLLEDEGASFWERVGSSKSACFGDRDPSTSTATVLDWARRRLSDEHCEVIGAVLRSVDSARVSALFLRAIRLAIRVWYSRGRDRLRRALPNLERLFLDNNQFGDEATVDLARAFVTGRLSKLTFLDLNRNRIADEGMAALAKAVAAGALENIATLYLHKNAIGDAGALAFVDAITGVTSQEQSRGVIVHGMRRARKVPSLCKLYLGRELHRRSRACSPASRARRRRDAGLRDLAARWQYDDCEEVGTARIAARLARSLLVHKQGFTCLVSLNLGDRSTRKSTSSAAARPDAWSHSRRLKRL